ELSLAAAAGVDLALHHIDRSGKRPRRRLRLVGAHDRDTVRDRGPVLLQELLRLIFVDVHRAPPPARFGAIVAQASHSLRTASTECSNILRSARFRSISMTRSTPPAPMIVGTPT